MTTPIPHPDRPSRCGASCPRLSTRTKDSAILPACRLYGAMVNGPDGLPIRRRECIDEWGDCREHEVEVSEAIVPTGEMPTEEKRHPWSCPWRGPGGRRCATKNRARDSHCRACGRPYTQDAPHEWQPGDGLAERISVTAAVEEYQRLADEVRETFARLHAIEERLGALFLDQCDSGSVKSMSLHSHRGHAVSFAEPDEALGHVEREIWGAIIARSGVGRICSNKRWEEMMRQLDGGEVPPLTPENVTATIERLSGDADELLSEKVAEVFNFLRPHGDRFKTNSQFEIGNRVVLEYMIEKFDARWPTMWRPRVNWRQKQMLSSLESLFRTLDGSGVATEYDKSDLEKAIESSDPEKPQGETVYFKFKAHRSGTLHLTFKRADLVAKLNAIAGGKNLRGERRGKAA